jgi:hypothetical protein
MTPRCIATLLVVASLPLAPRAGAQASTTRSAITEQSALANKLARFRKNELLRVSVESGLLEGQIEAIARDTLRLRMNGAAVLAVPERSVRKVWVKRNTRAEATGIGAMIGAVVGASIGTVSRGENPPCASTGCTDHPRKRIATHTIVGGVTGGLIGALAGSAFRHWAQIFPD